MKSSRRYVLEMITCTT
ncbi:hypothetical protein F383_03037 [Gossypium arboreum]|uniref:Uncharacterized protein n=1 Tax=Gossypium arboreum TaxID=29729 RepID=A0A0B0PAZ8_GOSAR|nr:hypothetical protein F383_03037 [Gossypium arboreum]